MIFRGLKNRLYLDVSPRLSYYTNRGSAACFMIRPDEQNDQTKILRPLPAVKKNSSRFQGSLVILKGYAEGMEYPIEKNYTVIGRDTLADIALRDPLISRQHVAVIMHEGAYILKDLDSTNGTSLKGALIQQADLHHADVFVIGNTTLQFVLEETGVARTYEIT